MASQRSTTLYIHWTHANHQALCARQCGCLYARQCNVAARRLAVSSCDRTSHSRLIAKPKRLEARGQRVRSAVALQLLHAGRSCTRYVHITCARHAAVEPRDMRLLDPRSVPAPSLLHKSVDDRPVDSCPSRNATTSPWRSPVPGSSHIALPSPTRSLSTAPSASRWYSRQAASSPCAWAAASSRHTCLLPATRGLITGDRSNLSGCWFREPL
jgi:hypothetical protein